jgi:hypothetical protein
MVFTKKFDRAFQWAGEKMGQEAKTSHSDEFRTLEMEMALRHDGTSLLRLKYAAAYKLQMANLRLDGQAWNVFTSQ